MALAVVGVHLTKVGRNWPLGDWLINYEGGFVRRGLLGEALLLLGRALHVDPIILAALLCLACYAVLLAGLWWLLRTPLLSWWTVFAMSSPAMLTFPMLSTRAGFHKEVLLYAAVTAVLFLFREGRRPHPLGLSLALSVACLILILSHEPVIFYLPYLFVVPVLTARNLRVVVRTCALPGLVVTTSFALVLRHIGSPRIVQAICSSIHASIADPCADPIGFLTMTRAGQLSMVQGNIAEFHYLRIFPVLLVLSLLPLVLGFADLWRRIPLQRAVRWILAASALSAAASLVLFRFAPDWGRWIAMHVVCLTLLLLWLAHWYRVEDAPQSSTVPSGRWVDLAWSLGLVVYATCWSMPGFGDTPLHGIAGMLLHRP